MCSLSIPPRAARAWGSGLRSAPSSGSGAIKLLVRALRTGTPTAKENVACALLRLSQMDENKVAIGRSGAIPLLVSLLESGGSRGKKDVSTALYSLCFAKENKVRAVQAGAMRPLVELMADLGSSMVDKAAFVVNTLVGAAEARWGCSGRRRSRW